MSNKRYNPVLKTQGSQNIVLPLQLAVPTLAYPPVFGEGNPTGQSTGPYFSAQRGATGAVAAGFTGAAGGPTGLTGCILLRTADAYPGIVSAVANITPPEGTRDIAIVGVKRVQMSDYTWAISFYVVEPSTGDKIDPPAGTLIDVVIVARDTRTAL